MLHWILVWFLVWLQKFALFFVHPQQQQPQPQPQQQQPQPPQPEDVYKTKHKDCFLAWAAADKNKNVDAEFLLPYADYWKVVKQKDNFLEQTWKRRLLMEATPRGLLIMHYDAFKRGFAYYSDCHMPYGLLNAAAMKYVRIFKCADFFIDQEYVPSSSSSPLIQLEKDQDTEEKKKKSLQGPFIKKPKPEIKKIVSELFYRNRFVNLGKIVNCNLLQQQKQQQQPEQQHTYVVGNTSYKFWKGQQQHVTTASQLLKDLE
jgi:hypothetical protein